MVNTGVKLGGRAKKPVISKRRRSNNSAKRRMAVERAELVKAMQSTAWGKHVYNHGRHVSNLSLEIARAMKAKERLRCIMGRPVTLEEIREVALFHDIGKIPVGKKLVDFPHPLGARAREKMNGHVSKFPALAKQALNGHVLYGISAHHEYWNGRGYPRRLKANDIPFTARLVAIVDSYYAMIEGRPYHKPLSHHAAVAEIRKGAGTKYDPVIVDYFVKIVKD